MLIEAQTPFQFASNYIHTLGWGVVLLGVWKFSRFLTKMETRAEEMQVKFLEVHKAVTNDMSHDVEEAVTLLRKQDQRWDQWMAIKAAQKSGD